MGHSLETARKKKQKSQKCINVHSHSANLLVSAALTWLRVKSTPNNTSNSQPHLIDACECAFPSNAPRTNRKLTAGSSRVMCLALAWCILLCHTVGMHRTLADTADVALQDQTPESRKEKKAQFKQGSIRVDSIDIAPSAAPKKKKRKSLSYVHTHTSRSDSS